MLSPCFLPSSATCHALSFCCMTQCISVFDNYIMCPISAVQMLAFHRHVTPRISKSFIFIIFAVFPFIQNTRISKKYPLNWKVIIIVSLFCSCCHLCGLKKTTKTTTWLKQLWYILGSLSYQRLYSHNVCAWKSHCFFISAVYS